MTKKTGKKKTTKKPAKPAVAKVQKPKPRATKPAAKPKAALTFKEVRFAHDLIGRKAKLMPLSLKGEPSFDVKVVNVDLNAGVYVVNVRSKQGTFIYPIDQCAIQVV